MFLDDYGKFFIFTTLEQTRLLLPLEDFKAFYLTPELFPTPHSIIKLSYAYNGVKQAVCWFKYYTQKELLAIFSKAGADYQFNPADGADCHFQSLPPYQTLHTFLHSIAQQNAALYPHHFKPLQTFINLPELQINQ